MHREFPILLEDMVRSFHKLVDLMSASMGRAREEGRAERVPETGQESSEMSEASVEVSAVDAAPRRLAALLADAAKERAEASRPADPVPAEVVRPEVVRPEVVRPHRPLKVPEEIPDDPGPAPPDGEAAEPLPLEEFPPEVLWYPALIIPESKLGAEARRVLRWLEAKAAAPAPAKEVNRV